MTSNYLAWEISETDFPRNAGIEAQIRFLIGYGILAPSVHNTQPWVFDVQGRSLSLRLNPKLALPASDPSGRGGWISLGAVTKNIEIAAAYFGLDTDVVLDNTEVKMSFQLGKPTDDGLFKAVRQRYSNKLNYSDQLISKEQLATLQQLTPEVTTFVSSSTIIARIAGLHVDAVRNIARSPRFGRELAHWMRPNNTSRSDGMPGFVVGLQPIFALIVPALINIAPWILSIRGKKDRQLILNSPAIGVISTPSDSPADWFAAGRAFELLALQATKDGLVMTIMEAMVEYPPANKTLAEILQIAPSRVQVFFRTGYAYNDKYHTPRRII